MFLSILKRQRTYSVHWQIMRGDDIWSCDERNENGYSRAAAMRLFHSLLSTWSASRRTEHHLVFAYVRDGSGKVVRKYDHPLGD